MLHIVFFSAFWITIFEHVGKGLYLIQSGEARVVTQNDDKKEQVRATFSGLHVQSACGQKPCSLSEEQAIYGLDVS